MADNIDADLGNVEQNINSLFTDVHTLINSRYPQAGDLEKRVKKLHERWVEMKKLLLHKIAQPLANLRFPVEEKTVTKHLRTVQEVRNVDTNPHFRSLQESIEWCKSKLVSCNLILEKKKCLIMLLPNRNNFSQLITGQI